MVSEQLELINKLGLHARAAGKLVSTTSRFESSIKLGTENKMVDAKSIMSIMLLAAGCGTRLQLEIEGEDEQQAYEAIERLFNDRFGEDE